MKTIRLPRLLLLLFLAGGWGFWMFLQIDHFNVPSLDALCYFAPAAFATAPFHLSTPLLAGFEGADHSWGANWPGGLLILSCLTPFLPKSPSLYVVLFVFLWFLISALTGWWTRTVTGKPFWGWIAFSLGLFNRDLFERASWERHELLSCLALLGAIHGVFTLSQAPFSRNGRAILSLSFFLLPLMHPVTLLAGGALLAASACLGAGRKEMPGYLPLAGGAYCAGLGCLAFYFYRDANAWLLFLDNAGENVQRSYDPVRAGGHFFFGRMFLMRLFRVRFFPANLVYLGALLSCSMILWRAAGSIWRGETDRVSQFDKSPSILTAAFFLATLSATQLFSNLVYPALAVPFAIPLVCSGLERMRGDRKPLRSGLALGFLFAVSISYFIAKTWVMARQGWPDYRRELADVKAGLPPAHLTLIPSAMWETVLGASHGYAMNTTPNFNARKFRYDTRIYGQLRSGDLVLLDSFDAASPPTYAVGEPLWEKIGEKKHLWRASENMTGYDITIWRKR